MTRVAVVDLGTNTTRLLVADVDDDRVHELVRRTTITRLGEGVDERRRLLPVPIARVRNCLSEYRRELEALGAERTLAIATSAVRDAENGEAFLGEIEWSYGFETRLLSGHEEALLTFRGVTTARALGGRALIVDLGGGSTELVVGGPDAVEFHESIDMGSVRMTERFLPSDPPTRAELSGCAAAVRSLLAERVPDELRDSLETAIGVAGTVTTLAALDLGLEEYDSDRVHGHRISTDGVEAQLRRLASVPLAERRRIPALEAERAPVIVAGAVIVREVLAHFGLAGIEASERDIMDGAALAAAALPAPIEGNAPPGAYTCC
ncbi:MAG TPA: Ppx/GppA phosphatase family protein [Gaiellaceae bacterium]|nr:Ppx/GppA phosphatase family protein [Gaiellaceae bacterium]